MPVIMMIQQNELVTLILALIAVVFFATAQTRLREMPGWRWFIGGFALRLAGWVFTVVEEQWRNTPLEGVLDPALNDLEHICYALSSIAIAVWCYLVFVRRRGAVR